MNYFSNKNQSGFALLMALVVVSVVVSIGLTVLELSLKQIRLSTNSRESETAFHATNAGLECARYWRIASSVAIEAGSDFTPSCFGENISAVSPTSVAVTSGTAFLYQFDVSWGESDSSAPRCSRIGILAINSPISSTAQINSMQTIFPGYPYGATKTCNEGGRCTVISVRGYSRVCGSISETGTIERQVLLEL